MLEKNKYILGKYFDKKYCIGDLVSWKSIGAAAKKYGIIRDILYIRIDENRSIICAEINACTGKIYTMSLFNLNLESKVIKINHLAETSNKIS